MRDRGWTEAWWRLLESRPTCENFVELGARLWRSPARCHEFVAFSESQTLEPGPLTGAVTATRSILHWLRPPGNSASTMHRAGSEQWWFRSLMRHRTPRNWTLFGACAEQSEELCSRFLLLCESAENLPKEMLQIAAAVRVIYARLRWASAAAAGGRALIASQFPSTVWRRVTLLTSAFVVVCATCLWLHAFAENSTWRTISTRTGEFRHVSLPDGSTVEANTDTTLRYRFTGNQRALKLVAGEARFTVARERRPFTLMAGSVSVRDIGTVFAARVRGRRKLEVRVIDGEVGLDQREAPRLMRLLFPSSRMRTTYSVRVRAGYIALAEYGKLSVTAVDAAELERRDAWRFGQISLLETPLGEALSEFNRYNRNKMEIADRALESLTLGGSYDARQPETFLRALLHIVPVRVSMVAREDGGGFVYQVHRVRNGTLQGSRLDEIALAFNQRHNRPRFVIEGTARSEPVWVTVDLDKPEEFVRVLKRNRRLEVRRSGGRVVVRERVVEREP